MECGTVEFGCDVGVSYGWKSWFKRLLIC